MACWPPWTQLSSKGSPSLGLFWAEGWLPAVFYIQEGPKAESVMLGPSETRPSLLGVAHRSLVKHILFQHRCSQLLEFPLARLLSQGPDPSS